MTLLHKRAQKILYIIAAVIFSLVPTSSIQALSEKRIRWYDSNQIMFFNPEEGCVPGSNAGGGSEDSGPVTILPGGSNAEKIWNWFASAGIAGVSDNPNAIAGILGNMMAEAGENPNPFAENAGGCFGLYQGCGGRSASLRAAFAEAGLQTSGGNVDKAIDVTLTHLVTADDGSFTTFANATPSANRPENYSDMFLVVVERAVGGSDPIIDANANARGGGGLYQHAAKRRNYAKSAYASFSGNTLQPSDTSTIIQTNTQTIMGQSDCPREGEEDSDTNIPESADLISGGMNLAQATAFMEVYRSIKPRTYAEPGGAILDKWKINQVDINKATNDCWSNLENCVAVVQWFICEYGGVCTGLPHGGQVVSTLLNSGRGFINGGHTPKPYAVFSVSGSYGHTGIVLGVDKERGKIIIGEAGCACAACDFSFTGAKERDLSEFTSGRYSYAYTDNIIHIGS